MEDLLLSNEKTTVLLWKPWSSALTALLQACTASAIIWKRSELLGSFKWPLVTIHPIIKYKMQSTALVLSLL